MLLQILILSVATATTGLAGVSYGAPPPDVPLPIRSGPERVAKYHGKVVILHFWATWCHYCLDELPKFVKLRQTYGKRVVVITVSNEPADVAASYLRLWNMELPVVEDTSSTVFKAYGIGPLPDTVILDPSGKVVYAEVGVSNFDDLHKAIEQALGP